MRDAQGGGSMKEQLYTIPVNDAFDANSLENLVIAEGGILQLNDEASCISAKNKFAAVADRIISPA